jgi:hypothetical protein
MGIWGGVRSLTSGFVSSSPGAIADGAVYVGSFDRHVYASRLP